MPVTHCTTKTIQFSSCKKRKVEANFTGGDITSDGGVLLLREVDKKLGLTRKLAALAPDPRRADHITHSLESLLKQRIYGIAAGYEDLNDHDTLKGSNPRFIVTNLSGDAQSLYDDVYCARGDMENRIKEQQLDLFADRTSCHDWWPNQFRLLLSSAAYVLLSTLIVLSYQTGEPRRSRFMRLAMILMQNTGVLSNAKYK